MENRRLSDDGEGSRGPTGQMDRLTYQIQEAKASLHRYVQDSPLRSKTQQHSAMGEYAAGGMMPSSN